MGIAAFRGKPFEHTHENKAFDILYDLLDAHCTATSQDWLLLGNFFVGSREIDAMVVKPNAVILIDFKDFSGSLQFSEDGPWIIDNCTGGEPVEVKGGSSRNPLIQLRKNKRSVMDFLGRNFAELNEHSDWGHSAALVIFQGTINFDTATIPGSIKPWFHISDMSRCVRDMEAIVSKKIHFSPEHLNAFAMLLGLETFVPAGSVDTRKLFGTQGIEQAEFATKPTSHQRAALVSFHSWLTNREGVFRLLGMASTGKRFLFPVVVNAIQQEGLEVILLTPSARLSANYFHPQISPVSIYTWLYEQSPGAFEKRDDRKIAIYPVRQNLDLNGKIPVLVDAHLLSDEELEIVDRRYGSGRLISDFLSAMKEKHQPFVVIGDPYQLPRGSVQRSLTQNVSLESMGLTGITHLLTEQIIEDPEDSLGTLQAHLVNSLVSSRFTRLPHLTGSRVETIDSGSSRKWQPDTRNILPESMYLLATHDQVAKINAAVKSRILGHSNPASLAPGDRIDFHSRTPILDSEDSVGDDTLVRWINAGEMGLVDEVCGDVEVHSVELRGRPHATLVRFQRARCRIARLGQVEFRYLVDFFESPRPELAPELYLALQVLARKIAGAILSHRKESLPPKENSGYKQAKQEYDKFEYFMLQAQGYLSAARIRAAHAISVHRAQGRHWPRVWLDASRSSGSENAGNQDYFRWLYTASICSQELLVLYKLPFLSPLSSATFSRSQTLAVGPFPFKRQLQYNKDRKPTETESSFPLPIGFSDVRLLPLLLTVIERTKGSTWALTGWHEHVYQVLLELRNEVSGSIVKLKLHYDNELSVTNAIFVDGDDTQKNSIEGLLLQKFAPASPALVDAALALEERLSKAGFSLISGKETSYRLQLLYAVGAEGVEVELNANKEGMISSLRILKATSEEIVLAFEHAVGERE